MLLGPIDRPGDLLVALPGRFPAFWHETTFFEGDGIRLSLRAFRDHDVMQTARFFIGQVVRHRVFPFRGVIFDVDPVFDNTEDWYLSIPAEVRPRKDQPFYHLFAENSDSEYVAYVSEQNLVPDDTGTPVRHPQVPEVFDGPVDGAYRLKGLHRN